MFCSRIPASRSSSTLELCPCLPSAYRSPLGTVSTVLAMAPKCLLLLLRIDPSLPPLLWEHPRPTPDLCSQRLTRCSSVSALPPFPVSEGFLPFCRHGCCAGLALSLLRGSSPFASHTGPAHRPASSLAHPLPPGRQSKTTTCLLPPPQHKWYQTLRPAQAGRVFRFSLPKPHFKDWPFGCFDSFRSRGNRLTHSSLFSAFCQVKGAILTNFLALT